MAKKSKAEVKPEIEPQINETETTPEVEETVEVVKEETPVKEKATKKSESPFDNPLWNKDSGISEEQYKTISRITKEINPSCCLAVGFNSNSTFAVLESGTKIDKFLTLDTKLNDELASKFSKNYKNFKAMSANSNNFETILSEFNSGIQFLLIDVGSNRYECSQALSNSRFLNDGGVILVVNYGQSDISDVCNQFLQKSRHLIGRWSTENNLMIMNVRHTISRNPTS